MLCVFFGRLGALRGRVRSDGRMRTGRADSRVPSALAVCEGRDRVGDEGIGLPRQGPARGDEGSDALEVAMRSSRRPSGVAWRKGASLRRGGCRQVHDRLNLGADPLTAGMPIGSEFAWR